MRQKLIRILRFGKIEKRQIVLFLILSAVVYLIFPLIKLIPAKANLGNWYLLIVLPIYILVWSILIGIKKGFCPSFVIACSLLFLPCGLIYSFKPVWQYMVFYLVFSSICNLAVELLWVTRGHGKHTMDPEMLSQDPDRPIRED